ncbi:MAG: cbb3-type cytochrome oxidase subunit 3 [Betaproteobacteria bacterium]
MDINDMRSLITVVGFGCFLGLVAHVWRTKALPAHRAASQLVFEGEGGEAVQRHEGVEDARGQEGGQGG